MQQKGWDVDARLMSYATGLQHAEGGSGSGPHSGIPETLGAADTGTDGLTAFGSMLSNDSELSRTMEGAIAVAAAAVPAGPPSSCAVCGRPAAGGGAPAKALEAAACEDGALPQPPTERQQQAAVQRKPAENGTDDGHLPSSGGSGGGHMLQQLLRGACTAQFAAGVAVGVAAAGALWLRR